MTVKEYLLSGKENLGELAVKMYPHNCGALSYLSRKLHGKDNRTFTKKDAELALKFLKEKCDIINNLTIE